MDYKLPSSITSKIGKDLHLQPNHPICIIKTKIIEYLQSVEPVSQIFDNLPPQVSVEDNFDFLRISPDHVSRSSSDTYYVNCNTVLRTHTSAHQKQILNLESIHNSTQPSAFIVCGDVYRKDEIDKSHYPVFHQLEYVKVYNEKLSQDEAKQQLVQLLIGLVNHLFPSCSFKIKDDYFPFTEMSSEIEVLFNNKWLEILGCGLVHTEILNNCNIKFPALAFGLGLDRLAMILFKIPDIRLLWSDNAKFTSQFQKGLINEFKPFSNLDFNQSKDISFWIQEGISEDFTSSDTNSNNNHQNWKWNRLNDFYEIVRNNKNNSIIESVSVLDKFHNAKANKYSMSFRLNFSSIDSINNHAQMTQMANKIIQSIVLDCESQLSVKQR